MLKQGKFKKSKRSFWVQLRRQLSACRPCDLARIMLWRRFRRTRKDSVISVISPRFERQRICIRPSTSDWGTLLSTVSGYHLPVWPLPERPVIVDVGSNVGYTLLDFITRYKDAQVYGVEMDNANYHLALENTRSHSAIRILNYAIASKPGEVFYDKALNSDAFSISECGDKQVKTGVSVVAKTMNDLVRELKLTRIDYLKMDIEGAEYAIFTAKEGLEWLARVHQLNIETHACEACEDPRAIISAALTANGFHVEPSPSHWGSLVAVRR